MPKFVVLKAVDSLDDRLAAPQRDFFEGVLETNEIDGRLYGLPWYVDTRLLFYRTDVLAEAGFSVPPKTWNEWLAAMAGDQGAARQRSLRPALAHERMAGPGDPRLAACGGTASRRSPVRQFSARVCRIGDAGTASFAPMIDAPPLAHGFFNRQRSL
jgi:hypothetical protein